MFMVFVQVLVVGIDKWGDACLYIVSSVTVGSFGFGGETKCAVRMAFHFERGGV